MLFLDIPNVDYTTQQINRKEFVVIANYINSGKNLDSYTKTKLFREIESSVTYTGLNPERDIIPAPSELKKAMFRTGSKGILKALEK